MVGQLMGHRMFHCGRKRTPRSAARAPLLLKIVEPGLRGATRLCTSHTRHRVFTSSVFFLCAKSRRKLNHPTPSSADLRLQQLSPCRAITAPTAPKMATGVDAKLLKATKFPPEFNQKVDMRKVNLQVMKKWITGRISEILGNEDDVVIELCSNLIEDNRFPDIKSIQIQLTGFLDKDTPTFCKELWNLCLSAQASPQGVPKELLEAKKRELLQEKVPTLLDSLAQGLKPRRRPKKQPRKLDSDARHCLVETVVVGAMVVLTAGVAAAVDAVEDSATGTLEDVEERAVGEIDPDRHRLAVAAETRTAPLPATSMFRGADREDVEDDVEKRGGSCIGTLDTMPYYKSRILRAFRGHVGAERPNRDTEGRGSGLARQNDPSDRVVAHHQERAVLGLRPPSAVVDPVREASLANGTEAALDPSRRRPRNAARPRAARSRHVDPPVPGRATALLLMIVAGPGGAERERGHRVAAAARLVLEVADVVAHRAGDARGAAVAADDEAPVGAETAAVAAHGAAGMVRVERDAAAPRFHPRDSRETLQLMLLELKTGDRNCPPAKLLPQP
ncbi:hypothetical protein MAPG_06715 [Magnaporthiopsis poae ATCC 64411]|uniref:PWI domain-containing protein n=1 Tax=Magnaporthiopsis poae (strain ATCC 64411 / 73-15) TaxID=644358 RepID=A0A0C4E2S6_MAGP6|nr:hypothetical protein MAPG_06715 [Magnaporthiopsis poae ATCC 64411]